MEDEHIVGTTQGIMQTRVVKRSDPEDRWDRDVFETAFEWFSKHPVFPVYHQFCFEDSSLLWCQFVSAKYVAQELRYGSKLFFNYSFQEKLAFSFFWKSF